LSLLDYPIRRLIPRPRKGVTLNGFAFILLSNVEWEFWNRRPRQQPSHHNDKTVVQELPADDPVQIPTNPSSGPSSSQCLAQPKLQFSQPSQPAQPVQPQPTRPAQSMERKAASSFIRAPLSSPPSPALSTATTAAITTAVPVYSTTRKVVIRLKSTTSVARGGLEPVIKDALGSEVVITFGLRVRQ
jgi:hypothetical protein